MRLRSITNCAEQFSIEAMPSGSGWVAPERLSPDSTVESLSARLRDMPVPFTGPVFVARLAIN
jgi:hypothetical protein